jgi:RNA polymerase sigma-70 factor, ECF subfamily
MGDERTNEEWVHALRHAGDSGGARRDLRTVLVSGLRRVLTSRGVDPALAEDFAQEAMVRIDARLDSFRGESRFTSWALSVATRVAFDELRHQRWKDVSLESLASAGPVDFEDQQPTAEARLGRARVLEHLRRVIDHDLTARQRQALLGELAGLPHSELASQLAMTRNALYKLTHDARRKVKAGLLAAGITASEAAAVFE